MEKNPQYLRKKEENQTTKNETRTGSEDITLLNKTS